MSQIVGHKFIKAHHGSVIWPIEPWFGLSQFCPADVSAVTFGRLFPGAGVNKKSISMKALTQTDCHKTPVGIHVYFCH